MGTRRILLPLAGVLAGILVAGAGSALAEDGLPLDVVRAPAKLQQELPANVAQWPLRLQSQYLRLRADAKGNTDGLEETLRAQHRRLVQSLAAAGLDGAAEDADLSGEPARWPLAYRHEYVLLMSEGSSDAEARAAVRASFALRERLAKELGVTLAPESPRRPIVDGPKLGEEPKDWPLAWKNFAVELAVANLVRFADEQMSDRNALRLAVNQVRSFYYPEAVKAATPLQEPSKVEGINARLKFGD